jgi:hypothetical protein
VAGEVDGDEGEEDEGDELSHVLFYQRLWMRSLNVYWAHGTVHWASDPFDICAAAIYEP